MNIQQLKSSDLGVPEIIAEISCLMNSLYPEESNVLLPLKELDNPDVYFVGIYSDGELAACGAVVMKNGIDKYSELKRIYVKPSFRGLKLSKKILNHLIEYSSAQGYLCIRLETGNKQLAAIKLYQALGFVFRSSYGDYEYDPEAVYMELSV